MQKTPVWNPLLARVVTVTHNKIMIEEKMPSGPLSIYNHCYRLQAVVNIFFADHTWGLTASDANYPSLYP